LFAYQIIFDNLPSPLSYLNKQTFQISGWEEKLTLLFAN
jgi:hypothetical protein